MNKEQEYTPELMAAKKKFRKQLILTVVSSVVSLAVIFGATAAWFANNRVVDSSGLKMQTQSLENLVINEDAAQITDNKTSVEFTSDARILQPARNKIVDTTFTADSDTNLFHNTNPEAVSMNKGLAVKTAVPLTFEAVAKEDNSLYYQDYIVYIAAATTAFTEGKLTAQLEVTTEADPVPEYLNAATVDFYLGDDYKGTLNKIGKAASNSGDDVTKIELCDNSDIPLSTEGTLKITMRCYFDGGLLKDDTTTFVRTEGLTTTDFSMAVTFTAEAPEAVGP